MRHALKGARCYLSGPIEYDAVPDWRVEPTTTLRRRFKAVVFDPAADEKQHAVPALKAARAIKDYDEMVRICRGFVRKDLCLVDRCDFLISCLPHGVPTAGSHHEIIVADNAKKPVLLVCPQGKELVPLWFYGFIPHECMFGGWGELWKYLEGVDRGEQRDNRRWSFVYGLI
jgi:hypothetical protein